MTRHEIDRINHAVRNSDHPAVHAALQIAANDAGDFHDVVFSRALLAECQAALGSCSRVFVMALAALDRDATSAATLGTLEELSALGERSDALFATRWIAALAQDRALKSLMGTPEIRRAHGMSLAPAYGPGRRKRARATRQSEQALAEAIEQLDQELQERLLHRAHVTPQLIAALVCSIKLVGQHGNTHYLMQLDVIRRLDSTDEERRVAATVILLLVLEKRAREIRDDTGDWAQQALERALPGSPEARLAQQLLEQSWRETLISAIESVTREPWNDTELTALEHTASNHTLTGDITDVLAAFRDLTERLAERLDVPRMHRVILAAQRAIAAESAFIAELTERANGVATALQALQSISAEGVAVVEAVLRESREAMDATLSSRPVKRRILLPGHQSAHRAVATLVPDAGWLPVAGASTPEVLHFEYCPKSQSFDTWTTLLEINSHAAFPDIAQYLALCEGAFRGSLLDGTFRVLSDLELSAPRLHVDGSPLYRHGIVVRGDGVMGDRMDVQEFRQYDGRIIQVRVSARRIEGTEDVPGVLRILESLTPCLVDPTSIEASLVQERLVRMDQSLRTLFRRIYQMWQSQTALLIRGGTLFVSAFARAACSHSYQQFSDVICNAADDPCHLEAPGTVASTLLDRLDWTPAGSVAYAITVEQLLFAHMQERSANAALLLALANRAVAIYASAGKHHAIVRCLRILDHALPERVTEPLELRLLDGLMATRMSVHQHPEVLARVDAALIDLAGRNCWGLNEHQSRQLIDGLHSEVHGIAEHLALESLVPPVDSAKARAYRNIFASADEPFWNRPVRDVISGPAICRYQYRAYAAGVYLRPFDSAATMKVRHRLSAQRAGKLAAVSASAFDEQTISLEGALAVGTGIHLSAIGGARDSLGAGRLLVTDETWKQVVRVELRTVARRKRRQRLPRHCKLLFVVPATSAGVLWELRAMRRFGVIVDTYFIMPPDDSMPDAGAAWEQGRDLWSEATGFDFPNYDTAGGLFRFGTDGSVAERISFDELWDDRFAVALEQRLAAEHGRIYWIEWSIDDLLADGARQCAAIAPASP